MYQRLTLVGSVGNIPELVLLPSGTSKTTLSLATHRRYRDAHGKQIIETTWFRVTCLGKLAEVVAQYVQKGRMVLVEGRLQPDPQTGSPRVFERKDGTKGASFEIIASDVRFVPTGDKPSQQNHEEPGQEGQDQQGPIPF